MSTRALKESLCAAGVMVICFCVNAFAADPFSRQETAGKEGGGQSEESAPQPITVNGDTVEYLSDSKEVSATGNVMVVYKGTKLTCRKLVVNTQTKDCLAEGGVRLEDAQGVLEGERVTYNFQTRTGSIIEPVFRLDPYFGKAEKAQRLSDAEFVARRGYMSTCSYNHPHYRIKSSKMDFLMGEKVTTRDNTLYVGPLPMGYIPRYERSLKEPIMHVQVTPGKRKDWGPYVLSAWRYNLTQNSSGRIYFDYRANLGLASGFGTNYSGALGKGDFKFYYTDERPTEEGIPSDKPQEFERHFVRWRHRWDIDKRTNIVSEYYRITDEKRKHLGASHNFLKDYFYREYEKGSEPLSYALFHRSFDYSSLDVLLQKRTNHWFSSQIEKMPEASYILPALQMGESPFYFESTSSFASLNKSEPSTNTELSSIRLDTANKFSLPSKVSFVQIAPFVMSRQTFYDKDASGGSVSPRTVFYAGSDASTKFYRIFDVKTNALGLDINGLRHIITPTVAYSYNHEPTVSSSRLKQIDTIDSISQSNAATLELSNKLQTKRKNKTVELLDFRVKSAYTFKPKGAGSSFSDFLFDLQLVPYAWMRLDADATYNHRQDYISNANYDVNFDIGKGKSLGIGQRYQRKGSNEITMGLNWWLNPKWKFSVYERFNAKASSTLKRGLREQEYTVSRDLHCWQMDVTYNVKRDEGETIWVIFRVKAFPELEFGFDQSYHAPKAGAQP